VAYPGIKVFVRGNSLPRIRSGVFIKHKIIKLPVFDARKIGQMS
jgi:hypothetical protein